MAKNKPARRIYVVELQRWVPEVQQVRVSTPSRALLQEHIASIYEAVQQSLAREDGWERDERMDSDTEGEHWMKLVMNEGPIDVKLGKKGKVKLYEPHQERLAPGPVMETMFEEAASQSRTLAALFRRAAAGLETPDDLNRRELNELVEDILAMAAQLDKQTAKLETLNLNREGGGETDHATEESVSEELRSAPPTGD